MSVFIPNEQQKKQTHITIPPGHTEIEGKAFWDCSGLTQLTLPDTLTKIGHGAFNGCSGLTQLTLPDTLTEIGEGVFEGCAGLKVIVAPQGLHDRLRVMSDMPEGCELMTPQQRDDQLNEMGLSKYALSPEQILFLYKNKDRWRQLTPRELVNDLGDMPADLLSVIKYAGQLACLSLFGESIREVNITGLPHFTVRQMFTLNMVKMSEEEKVLKPVKEKAAVKIQAICRGRLARRPVSWFKWILNILKLACKWLLRKLGWMKTETQRNYSKISPYKQSSMASNDHSLNGKGVAEKIDQAADNEAVVEGLPVVSSPQR